MEYFESPPSITGPHSEYQVIENDSGLLSRQFPLAKFARRHGPRVALQIRRWTSMLVISVKATQMALRISLPNILEQRSISAFRIKQLF